MVLGAEVEVLILWWDVARLQFVLGELVNDVYVEELLLGDIESYWYFLS